MLLLGRRTTRTMWGRRRARAARASRYRAGPAGRGGRSACRSRRSGRSARAGSSSRRRSRRRGGGRCSGGGGRGRRGRGEAWFCAAVASGGCAALHCCGPEEYALLRCDVERREMRIWRVSCGHQVRNCRHKASVLPTECKTWPCRLLYPLPLECTPSLIVSLLLA